MQGLRHRPRQTVSVWRRGPSIQYAMADDRRSKSQRQMGTQGVREVIRLSGNWDWPYFNNSVSAGSPDEPVRE